ncbi:hypothetical protein EOA29_36095, partial [Mesorhizobium sp. M1E.F.Ca.ET.063.01.1.1]
LLGGDWLSSRLSPISKVAGQCETPKLPISGEMSGRTEGGERQPCQAATHRRSSLRCPRA